MPNIGFRHSKEAKLKMSAASRKWWADPENVIKASELLSGERNGMYGRNHTDEAKKIMRECRLGEKNPMFRKCYTDSQKAAISARQIGIKNPMYGKKHSESTKKKMSAAHAGKNNHMYGMCGEKAPTWKGGLSFEPYCPKFNDNLRRRIRAFFDFQCTTCGKSTEENGRNLSCHHVEYNKQACCDGKPVHFAALCSRCHNKTNEDRHRWEAMLHRIIDEIYDGRSYFTKDEWEGLQND